MTVSLSRERSLRHIRRSRKARPCRGTSWLAGTRAARPVSLGVQPDCIRAVVAASMACVLIAVIRALGLHVNLSTSAPRGLYRTVVGRTTRGRWIVALWGFPGRRGIHPVLK